MVSVKPEGRSHADKETTPGNLPSSQDGDSFEVERDQNRKICSSVFSGVERGRSQSSGVSVYSVVVTDLNQNPGALNFFFSVEEKDLNQTLFGRHLSRKEQSKNDYDIS